MEKVCGILEEKPSLLLFDYDLCGAEADDEDIEIPDSFRLPDELVPTCGSQEWTGMCAAFAFAGIIEILWAKETGEKVKHSPLFAYGYLRNESQRELVGTYVGQLLKRACMLGTVPESMMPGVMENPNAYDYVHAHPELPSLVIEAARRRIAGYAQFRQGNFDERIKAIKRAILKYRVPIFGDFLVSGVGHGVPIIGWKRDMFVYMNSYGPNVGDKGVCSREYSDLRTAYVLFDAKNLPKFPFVDVEEKHWAYHAVNRCYYSGIVNGISEDRFDPEGTLTRAQVARALYKLAMKKAAFDGDEFNYTARGERFRDVSSDKWFYQAIEYCCDKGVFKDGQAVFEPDEHISRGAFCEAIYNFVKSHCSSKKVLACDDLPIPFDDVAHGDDHYKGIVKCYSLGLINGMDEKTFSSDAHLSRAQLCQIIYKLIKVIEEREV